MVDVAFFHVHLCRKEQLESITQQISCWLRRVNGIVAVGGVGYQHNRRLNGNYFTFIITYTLIFNLSDTHIDDTLFSYIIVHCLQADTFEYYLNFVLVLFNIACKNGGRDLRQAESIHFRYSIVPFSGGIPAKTAKGEDYKSKRWLRLAREKTI